MPRLDVLTLAEELLAALDGTNLVTPPTERWPDLDFATAYLVAAESHRLRRARGEQPVGRKIGYTNRDMWVRYDVHQPIWNHVYAHTVQYASGNSAVQALSRMVAPLIEPEIAFKLRAPLPPGCTDPVVILQSVEWMAPAFEIVDCHYADWEFKGADSVIDFSHHAALMLGEPREIAAQGIEQLAQALRGCRVKLSRNNAVVDTGVGANALGHPALAMAFLADVVASQQDAAPLEAGEIVTTGTLTVARPVKPGETWRTDTEGLPLSTLEVRFVD
jgi:2-oxo-3-hexenedioate decarboxylase